MAEKETSGQAKCMVCQATSADRVLLQAEDKGKHTWVCVKCLPMLIHGGGH